jgi:hypothetical protein
LAASNCLAIVVNASFSEDAANTVIEPDSDADEEAAGVAGADELAPPAAVLLVLLDEQPARAAAAAAAMIRVALRRIT